jgi:hypothetical protein
MNTVVDFLNKRWLVALVVALVLLGLFRRFV